ncbi:hypothetical protein J4464_01180 [Candidatus Woesearchaeota archaeon]|nr:hypothetical protein [Candidatus Woesearchaeota archaeon]
MTDEIDTQTSVSPDLTLDEMLAFVHKAEDWSLFYGDIVGRIGNIRLGVHERKYMLEKGCIFGKGARVRVNRIRGVEDPSLGGNIARIESKEAHKVYELAVERYNHFHAQGLTQEAKEYRMQCEQRNAALQEVRRLLAE